VQQMLGCLGESPAELGAADALSSASPVFYDIETNYLS
jgi:hypothetical protein